MLIPEGCFRSVEFLFSNRKDVLVVTGGFPEIPTFREPTGELLLSSWGHWDLSQCDRERREGGREGS